MKNVFVFAVVLALATPALAEKQQMDTCAIDKKAIYTELLLRIELLELQLQVLESAVRLSNDNPKG